MPLKMVSKSSINMEKYTDGTALMTVNLPGGQVKPLNFMLGYIDPKTKVEGKPYFGIADPDGICSVDKQKIGPFNLNECKHNEVTLFNPTLTLHVRAEFSDKSQLIIKHRKKAFKGFDMAYSIGISLQPYTDNSTAGFFLAGDKNIPVIFMENTKTQRPLKGFENGTRKIYDINFDQEKRIIEITDSDHIKVRLSISEKALPGGFYELKVINK